MIRWLEGATRRTNGRHQAQYAADTPLGRATVKPVHYRHKGLIAWRGKLADGTEVERATARECMEQLEQIINLQLERRNRS